MRWVSCLLRARLPHTALVAIAAAAMVSATGCSDSDTPAGNGGGVDPSGTGTNTLLVRGDISGSDGGGGTFDTQFRVDVSDAGANPVSGAAVSIQAPFGTVTLVEDQQTAGRYTASRNSYTPGTYILNVTRGSDRVSGVRVSAPDIHTITSPLANSVIAADQPISVQWSRVAAAEEILVETRDYESPEGLADSGTHVVPPAGNPARNDQRIRVHRIRRQEASGGLSGSEFDAKIRNSVEPIIAQ